VRYVGGGQYDPGVLDERLEDLKVEARSSGTPVARLRELAGRDPGLARIVAMRIGLPAELAEELADVAEARGDVGTLRALAAHPVVTAERLAVLAGHADAGVRRAVALHRATPKRVLRGLAGDPDPAVRRGLAAREKLPKSIAGALLADESGDVRLTLARRHNARPEHLRALADDPDPRVRRLVTRLGYVGAAALTDSEPSVRRAAVDGCGVEQLAPHLDRIVRDPDARIRALAAEMNRNHSPEALAVLAADPDPAVRRAAAENWFTPEAALVALASDAEPAVLAGVCQNPFAPPHALAKIVEAAPAGVTYSTLPVMVGGENSFRWQDVFFGLRDHPRIWPESLRALRAKDPYSFQDDNAIYLANCPPDLLIECALSRCVGGLEGEEEHESWEQIDRAREKLAPPQVLAMMARSPIYSLRAGAAANRHTPPEAIAEYVRTADPEQERYTLDGVAANPATPVEILLDWASAGVRHHEMLQNPDLPEPVLRIIAADGNDYDAEKARLVLAVRAARTGTEEEC
jgi:hypothetical protein